MTDRDTHESYGLIRFNRVTGSPKTLFGTHLKPQHFIEMTVLKGERINKDGYEHYYGNEQLIRVWMSATQFAECITSMNMGMGVPCTIRSLHKEKDFDFPPEQIIETEKIQTYFRKRMKDFGSTIREKLKSVRTILDKSGSITKGDRNFISNSLSETLQEIELNIPFFLEEYEEASQKIVTQAKTEFDAFVTHAATRIGLDEIAKSGIKTILIDKEMHNE